MNLFYDDEGIIGKAEKAYLKNTLEEFFQLVKRMKNQLGKQGYLLDKYLLDLLNAIGHTPASDAADEGISIWASSPDCAAGFLSVRAST